MVIAERHEAAVCTRPVLS